MSINKLYRSIFAYVTILVGMCVGVNDIHAQYKLDLGDTEKVLLLDSNGQEVSLDSLKYDSILITGIDITYNDHKRNQLTIIKNDSIKVFEGDVTEHLKGSEIFQLTNQNGLFFNAGGNYKINHGDKSWNFKYTEMTSTGNGETPPPDESQKDSNDNGDNVTSALYGIIALLVLLAIILGVLWFMEKKKVANINSDNSHDSDSNTDNGRINDVNQVPSTEENLEESSITAEGILKELCDYPSFTLQEKRTWLQNKLDYNKSVSDTLTVLGKQLGIDVEKESELASVNQKINALQNEIKTLRDQVDSKDSGPDNSGCSNEIAEIYGHLKDKSKTNTELRSLLSRAEQSKASTITKKTILIRFINSLPESLKKPQPSPVTSDPRTITDSHLNWAGNLQILKTWMVGKLKDKKIEVRNPYSTTDQILEDISERIQQAIDIKNRIGEQKSEDEIISQAIERDRLNDADRRVILQRMISAINSALTGCTEKIKPNITKEDFVELVASKLSTPSDHEEAMNQVKERNISVINEVFGSDITDLTRDQLKMIAAKSVVSVVNKELGISVDTLEEAKKKLREINSTMSDLQKKYGVDNPSQLEKVIIDKKFEQVQKSVGPEVEILLPGEHYDSIQKLLNALIRIAKDSKESYEHAKEADELVQDSLQESIAIMNQNVLTEGKSLLELVDIYNTEISNKTKVWNEERDGLIQNNKTSLLQLSEKIKENESLKKDNESLQDKLKDESSEMVTYLHAAADKICDAWRPILKGCSEEDENQCMDIENRLRNNLFESLKSFERYKATDELNTSQTRKEIQNLLIDKLTMENSPFNVIGRYFAYSRLPFMTDTAREYGVIFNRKNIGTLYSAIEELYVYFGINLDIPVLFVMGIEEGEFINVTGRAYGDLDNLCQNSRNHFDNIDSKNKPSEVIVDVVQVGYAFADGNAERKKPTVLTY